MAHIPIYVNNKKNNFHIQHYLYDFRGWNIISCVCMHKIVSTYSHTQDIVSIIFTYVYVHTPHHIYANNVKYVGVCVTEYLCNLDSASEAASKRMLYCQRKTLHFTHSISLSLCTITQSYSEMEHKKVIKSRNTFIYRKPIRIYMNVTAATRCIICLCVLEISKTYI